MRFFLILFFVVSGNLVAAQSPDRIPLFDLEDSSTESYVETFSSRLNHMASLIGKLSVIKDNLAKCPTEIRERYDNLMEAWSNFKYICKSGYYSVTAVFKVSYYIYTQIYYLFSWLYQ